MFTNLKKLTFGGRVVFINFCIDDAWKWKLFSVGDKKQFFRQCNNILTMVLSLLIFYFNYAFIFLLLANHYNPKIHYTHQAKIRCLSLIGHFDFEPHLIDLVGFCFLFGGLLSVNTKKSHFHSLEFGEGWRLASMLHLQIRQCWQTMNRRNVESE